MGTASAPLHVRRVVWSNLILNRLHMLLIAVATSAIFYYRFTTIYRIIQTGEAPLLPHVLITFSEFVLTFVWVLHQGYRWRPVLRHACPERLPGDEKLPPLDVFICTADPSKEPSLGVMNTVVSAMSLDYPPEKLAVYLSDDGGSYVTLNAVREAWKFARSWVPFRRKYKLKIACPELYFSVKESAHDGSSEFDADRQMIEKRYLEFQEALEKNSVNASISHSRDHRPTIEVMTDEDIDSLKEMPLLVYAAREKRPGVPHHFKGGAINCLSRVAALLSNAPYFLVLDCDMYCNDPSSARQAMCYYLDPEISSKICYVQFPQKFRDVSKYDIYEGRLDRIWREGIGMDGLRGPYLYGCNFFMTRESFYGTKKLKKDVDLNQLKKSFGSSNVFIQSLYEDCKRQLPEDRKPSDALQKELQLVASCTYDKETNWGTEVGYRTFTVVEDAITCLQLHCKGWISVRLDPQPPCFLGSIPANLNDMLVQQMRWSFGLMQIGLSRFSPITYGPPKMGLFESLCYGAVVYDCLFAVPFFGFAIIPAICLLFGIPLYPKVSDPIFIAIAYIFIASRIKHVQEVFAYGDQDSFRTSLYEFRVWLMKCGSCYFYAILNAIMEKIGLHEADFKLTNKAIDDEQTKRLEMGIYDFQASPALLAPLCSLYILNLASSIIGVVRIFQKGDQLLAQFVLSLFGVIINYHLLEGMFLRKDNGRISPSVTRISIAISAFILCCGSFILLF